MELIKIKSIEEFKSLEKGFSKEFQKMSGDASKVIKDLDKLFKKSKI